MEYLKEIGILIFGGGLVSILNWWKERKKDSSEIETSEFKTLIEEYKTLYENSVLSHKECENRLKKLEMEVSSLKANVQLLNIPIQIPFPHWFKDSSFRMVDMSKEYVNVFIKQEDRDHKEYIGLTDHEYWGDEIGKSFRLGDLAAWQSANGFWVGKELIVVERNDMSEKYLIVKWVISINNVKIGVAGMAIPQF